jgi:hypothetical protein
MLQTQDGTERDTWEAVRVEANNVMNDLLDSLARKIVKETADAQERGKKKK